MGAMLFAAKAIAPMGRSYGSSTPMKPRRKPRRPGGRRTGCAAFFYGTWMSRRKIPAQPHAAALALDQSVFLWFVSFDAYQKK
jgi:hypothetical protein